MYEIAVKRNFIAQHFLIGGDWGNENDSHSHHYQIEVILTGNELDQYGYLVDIVHLDNIMDKIVSRYRDRLLNDFDEFNGLNPSIENFARILCEMIADQIKVSNVLKIKLQIWENLIAWASYTKDMV